MNRLVFSASVLVSVLLSSVAAAKENPYQDLYARSVKQMAAADDAPNPSLLGSANAGHFVLVAAKSKTCSKRCSTRCSKSCTTTRGCSTRCKSQTDGCGGSIGTTRQWSPASPSRTIRSNVGSSYNRTGIIENPYVKKRKKNTSRQEPKYRFTYFDGTDEEVISYRATDDEYILQGVGGRSTIPKWIVVKIEALSKTVTRQAASKTKERTRKDRGDDSGSTMTYAAERLELEQALELWIEHYEETPIAREGAWGMLRTLAEFVDENDRERVRIHLKKLRSIDASWKSKERQEHNPVDSSSQPSSD